MSLLPEGNGLPTTNALILDIISPSTAICSLRSTCGWVEISGFPKKFQLRIACDPGVVTIVFRLRQLGKLPDNFESILVEECIVHITPVCKIPKCGIFLEFKPPLEKDNLLN